MPKFSHLTPEHFVTAAVLLDAETRIVYMNQAAEQLFEISSRNFMGYPIQQALVDAEALLKAIQQASNNQASFIEHGLMLTTYGRNRLHLRCAVSPLSFGSPHFLLEFHPIDRSLKLAREEQMLDQTQANRLLLKNLAHEIKNPLGGIRGAAQLLEQELGNPALCEYTQIIIQEADRLRGLMERLLSPQAPSGYTNLNIHEVLERVRSVVLAEIQNSLTIQRDYDTSLPELIGDKEQLIQVMLNVVRNAAQAMAGKGKIILRTRVARQVTLNKQRHRLAVLVQIIDNGPGVLPELKDKIFYPLVSGRPDGHGLGLTLAQDYITQHRGSIEFESEPGHTCFTIILPLP